MRRLAFKPLIGLTLALVILNQSTSVLGQWRLNDEQKEVLAALCEHQRCIILKGRQVGVSTVCCLFDLAFAVANPGVNVAIVADKQDNSNALLAKIKAWAAHLGIPLTIDQTESITLANGSRIDALSAVARAEEGESRTGRSRSYLLVHATELGFWNNDVAVWRALTSGATSPNVRLIIESTASAAENLFKKMWEDGANGWHHVWLSIERHKTYRADPASISDATWSHLQEIGFTIRGAAAWWHAKIKTDFAGDEQAGLREFPVKPADCFAFAVGHWIHRFTAAEIASTVGPRTVYRGRKERVVFGVDTGAGLGGDHSAVVAIGEITHKIVMTWRSNTTPIPEFVRVIEDLAEEYQPSAIVCETNGIGHGVHQALLDAGAPVEEHRSGAEKHQRLCRLKNAIETGAMPVGPEIQEEIHASWISKPKGPGGAPVYAGRDDILNAASFAQTWVLGEADNAPPETKAPPDLRVVFVPPHQRKKRVRG